jgi:hypothetical protein
MIVEESKKNPLMYNLCMAITLADLIKAKNAKMLDAQTLDYFLSLEKSLAEVKDHLLDLIFNRNLQIMN